jgi:hypothetical protein
MLFKRKEKTTQAPPAENPRPPRYASLARVGINGFEGEAVLRNVSSGGFRMESRTYAAIGVGENYTMQVRPEDKSGIPVFDLEVEARWVKSTETSFNSGFLVTKAPAGRVLEKYIDYIKTRNS